MHLAAAVSAVTLGVTPARGQLLGGEVRDEQTQVPLVGLSVSLRRHAGDSSTVLRTVQTDSRGLFVVVLPAPGSYQLAFGIDTVVLALGPVETIADSLGVSERRYLVPVTRLSETEGFHEYQVQKPALAISGSGAPSYPAALKAQDIEGKVIASFMVDASGRAERDTFRTLQATHPEFARAVRDALPRMRFVPARIAGVAVRQRVQQAFEFRLHGFIPPFPPPGRGTPTRLPPPATP